MQCYNVFILLLPCVVILGVAYAKAVTISTGARSRYAAVFYRHCNCYHNMVFLYINIGCLESVLNFYQYIQSAERHHWSCQCTRVTELRR